MSNAEAKQIAREVVQMTSNPRCCPTCGRAYPNASAGGKARWASLTPEQRSAEMSRRRKKGMKNLQGKQSGGKIY